MGWRLAVAGLLFALCNAVGYLLLERQYTRNALAHARATVCADAGDVAAPPGRAER